MPFIGALKRYGALGLPRLRMWVGSLDPRGPELPTCFGPNETHSISIQNPFFGACFVQRVACHSPINAVNSVHPLCVEWCVAYYIVQCGLLHNNQ